MNIIYKMQFNSFLDFLSYFKIDDIINHELLDTIKKSDQKSNRIEFERLEFLGDAMLNFILSEELFIQHKDIDQKKLSNLRSFLVSRELAYEVGLNINIVDLLKENSRHIIAKSNISCSVETLIAILYFIKGFEITRMIVLELFWKYIDNFEEDPKMQLQELCQKKFQKLPLYTCIEKVGTEHEPIFTVEVTVDKFKEKATGENKKLAEKKAAVKLLMILK